jgi:hypothetical protein
LRNLRKNQQYGWLWNSVEHPARAQGSRGLRGRQRRADFHGHPALDLVIAFTGGNYADPALFIPQRVFVPQFIVPAVN